MSLVWGCGRSREKSGLEMCISNWKPTILWQKMNNVYCVFEGSRPANEYKYLARSEEMEGSSDFVALGESSESKAVSGFKILDFGLQRGTRMFRYVGTLRHITILALI